MATSRGVAGLLCFALMAAAASATQFRVGGDKGWAVPDGTVEPYNTWAARMRFQIGDQLLFVYPKETDSVLLVDQAAYNACNTTTYITKFDGGTTVFTLDRSGPFFFISGNQASCTANQKLIVVVLAASHTPPGLSPTPPSSMPPTSAAPMPSPPSMSPPSPPSMMPPSAAPMPSPSSSPPSMMPPSAAPGPSPSSSPPSMLPPSAAPGPSPSSSPPSMLPPSAAPGPSPMSPPSAPTPTGSAPAAAPGSSPGTPGSSPPSSSPGTPGGVPQPPADTTSPPASDSTTPGSGAAPLTAGLITTLAAGFGYALLAV